MHILIDIGNSTIVIAMADSGCEINSAWRFKTLKDETVSFFRYELKAGIKKYGIQISDIETITISSVVPEVNDYIAQAIIDITGITPLQYILSQRISNAQLLLESTDYSISEISNLVGYDNPLYFSRLFCKQRGMSPRNYRDMIRN